MVKNPPVNAGYLRDMDSIPGQEDPLKEGMTTHSSILEYPVFSSILENPMDRGAWQATVHSITKSQT